MNKQIDFLVIGSGIAGLSYALQIADYGSVIIITKKKDNESNTNYAQGGIASVFDSKDSFEAHYNDTIDAGAGLCHEEAVRFMVSHGPDVIKQLIDIGVAFSRTQKGKFELGIEGGHSHHRIVHAHDFTGQEIENALLYHVKQHPNIKILQKHIAIDLITEHQTPGRDFSKGVHCWGAYVLDIKKNRVKTILAKTTLLATGGCGQVYLHTSNPMIATGDGIAMAYRAGAKIANMEFMQFHPTTLFSPAGRTFLISEAVRGYGAILRTKQGEAFMKKYDDRAELAPRDIVARSIDSEMKKSGDPCVYLDLTHKKAKEISERFPNIYNNCLKSKIDITKDLIPVVPAAHYMCGGVVVDKKGRTNIERLFVCGEAAFTGVHGANRLASNSLLEAVVFSNMAVKAAVKLKKEEEIFFPEILPWNDEGTFNQDEWVYIFHDRQVIRSVMWDYVGIVRSGFRLARALRRLNVIVDEVEDFYRKTTVTNDLIELRNIATVAKLILQSAITRKESRGLHYMTDYPKRDDKFWRHDTLISLPVS
jgi:L-aspartate oxidase